MAEAFTPRFEPSSRPSSDGQNYFTYPQGVWIFGSNITINVTWTTTSPMLNLAYYMSDRDDIAYELPNFRSGARWLMWDLSEVNTARSDLLVLRGVVEGEDFQSSMFYVRDLDASGTSSAAVTATTTGDGSALSGLPSVSRLPSLSPQSSATPSASTIAESSDNSLGPGEIAGLAVGVTLAFVAMMVCLAFFLMRVRRKRRGSGKATLDERISEKHRQKTELPPELSAERKRPNVEDLDELVD